MILHERKEIILNLNSIMIIKKKTYSFLNTNIWYEKKDICIYNSLISLVQIVSYMKLKRF